MIYIKSRKSNLKRNIEHTISNHKMQILPGYRLCLDHCPVTYVQSYIHWVSFYQVKPYILFSSLLTFGHSNKKWISSPSITPSSQMRQIEWWRNTLSPATAVSDWTAVVSARRKQNVSHAANKQSPSFRLQRCNGVADLLIEIQLPLVVVKPSRWFANRCGCAVSSSVTTMTTNNAQIYSWVG